jgi:hypothetical protein
MVPDGTVCDMYVRRRDDQRRLPGDALAVAHEWDEWLHWAL